MKLRRLNLITAAIAAAGAVLWMLTGSVISGLLWLLLALFWLGCAIWDARPGQTEPSPVRRLGRRVSKMLLWFT